MSKPSPLLCPSARCEPGSILLGIVQANGEVAFTPDKFEINEEFVNIASKGRTPETRFRFANICRQRNCQQWLNGQCGVVEAIIEEVKTIDHNYSNLLLPNCSIRNSCRWFAQRGEDACKVCSLVITELPV